MQLGEPRLLSHIARDINVGHYPLGHLDKCRVRKHALFERDFRLWAAAECSLVEERPFRAAKKTRKKIFLAPQARAQRSEASRKTFAGQMVYMS